MKERTKKSLIFITEIGTIIWAISGIYQTISPAVRIKSPLVSEGSMEHFIAFYFLSAVLILYLLKKYERLT